MPLLSVIIVSYNTCDLTLRCVEHLQTMTPDIDAEVWVVDNASQDDTVARIRARFPHVRLIANEQNVGFGPANNQAMQEASGKYFLLLNSDAFPEPGAVQKLITHLEAHPQTGIVAPELLNEDGTHQPLVLPVPSLGRAWLQALGLTRCTSRWNARYVTEAHLLDSGRFFFKGAVLMLRQEVYRRVGGFDPAFFFFFEEADWQARIREANWELAYVPEAEFYHLAGSSPITHFQRFVRMTVATDTYVAKYHSSLSWALYRLSLILWSIRIQGQRKDTGSLTGTKWVLRHALASSKRWRTLILQDSKATAPASGDV